MASKWRDVTGVKFGRLVAVEYQKGSRLSSSGRRVSMWLCRCDCGASIEASVGNLTRGDVSSCGCLRREVTSRNRRKHGQSGASPSPEYVIWKGMISRCVNPKHKSFKDYGGRGVRVCAEWMADFQAFINHVGPRPSRYYSIDRCDNNGKYEPGNVRWATRSEQRRNTRPVVNCRRGHALTPENTYINPYHGKRACRICMHAQYVARRQKNETVVEI